MKHELLLGLFTISLSAPYKLLEGTAMSPHKVALPLNVSFLEVTLGIWAVRTALMRLH